MLKMKGITAIGWYSSMLLGQVRRGTSLLEAVKAPLSMWRNI